MKMKKKNQGNWKKYIALRKSGASHHDDVAGVKMGPHKNL